MFKTKMAGVSNDTFSLLVPKVPRSFRINYRLVLMIYGSKLMSMTLGSARKYWAYEKCSSKARILHVIHIKLKTFIKPKNSVSGKFWKQINCVFIDY